MTIKYYIWVSLFLSIFIINFFSFEIKNRTVDITNVADTFGNELKHCLYSFNPEVHAIYTLA